MISSQKQLLTCLTRVIMNPNTTLSKALQGLKLSTEAGMGSRGRSSLIGLSGGALTPSFFQAQRDFQSQVVQGQQRKLSAPAGGDLSPETRSKLEALKEKLSKNAYFEKYKEKFLQMETSAPRELLARLEQLDARTSGPAHTLSGKGAVKSRGPKDHFLLKDVMEVDRIKGLERDDVVFLWQEFHRKKEGLLGAVMSGTVFDRLEELAKLYPMFLMPMPRPEGYEFFLVQYMNRAFHFTPLLAYQAHQENAPECLRLIFYTDLKEDKDLVLMRGEFDKNLLATKDAHVMAVQVNFYYGETSESRQNLLEVFSKKSDTFQHMELIDELKKLQETHAHLFEFEE